MPPGSSVWENILKEVDATSSDWINGFVPVERYFVEASSNQFVANETQRALVQQMGEAHGCHTCNKHIENTTQTFIVDHIPPRGIFSDPEKPNIIYRFFPHCDQCANAQANLVKSIVNAKGYVLHALQEWSGRTDEESLKNIRHILNKSNFNELGIKLLTGGSGPSVPGHGGDPTAKDRQNINDLPKPIACHSCGRQQALFIYHADHCPPKEFAMTAWFKNSISDLATTDETIAKIKKKLATSFFRPQCPTCSHTQGGRCQHLVEIVQAKLKKRPPPTTKTRAGRVTKVLKYGQERIDE